MGDDTRVLAAYDFLLDHARTGAPFTSEELGRAANWTGSTPGTYLTKQLRSVVKKLPSGRYSVKKNFIHLERDDFRRRVSQKESILPSYRRASFESVLTYEFLMPLTREDLLRAALDRLLYKDTLQRQIHLVGFDRFDYVVPRRANEAEEIYCARIAKHVGHYFGGYSITHVTGRFRVADLLNQSQAIGRRYVIDETTALVRFIIPLDTSRTIHGEAFGSANGPEPDAAKLKEEIQLVRKLFLEIFAEVVVHSVQGEDEIWLLETIGGEHRLYKWEIEESD